MLRLSLAGRLGDILVLLVLLGVVLLLGLSLDLSLAGSLSLGLLRRVLLILLLVLRVLLGLLAVLLARERLVLLLRGVIILMHSWGRARERGKREGEREKGRGGRIGADLYAAAGPATATGPTASQPGRLGWVGETLRNYSLPGPKAERALSHNYSRDSAVTQPGGAVACLDTLVLKKAAWPLVPYLQ